MANDSRVFKDCILILKDEPFNIYSKNLENELMYGYNNLLRFYNESDITIELLIIEYYIAFRSSFMQYEFQEAHGILDFWTTYILFYLDDVTPDYFDEIEILFGQVRIKLLKLSKNDIKRMKKYFDELSNDDCVHNIMSATKKNNPNLFNHLITKEYLTSLQNQTSSIETKSFDNKPISSQNLSKKLEKLANKIKSELKDKESLLDENIALIETNKVYDERIKELEKELDEKNKLFDVLRKNMSEAMNLFID